MAWADENILLKQSSVAQIFWNIFVSLSVFLLWRRAPCSILQWSKYIIVNLVSYKNDCHAVVAKTDDLIVSDTYFYLTGGEEFHCSIPRT